MDDLPSQRVLQYASPRPPLVKGKRRIGELGALPALVCLILVLYGVFALALAGVAALGTGFDALHSLPVTPEATVLMLVGFPSGVAAFVGAGWVSRTYRKPGLCA